MRLVALLVVLFVCISSFAQNSKIQELEQQRERALRDISNTDKLLKETTKSTTSILDRIKLISNQLFSRQKILELLEQEINSMDVEEKRIEKEVTVLEEELKEKQKSYGKAVEGMLSNRQGDNKILFVLSGKSLTESYRRLRYLQDYSDWRSKQAGEIKSKSEALKEKKEILIKTRQGKTVLLNQRKQEQANLEEEEKNYQQEVKEAQKKQKDLQQVLAQKRKQAQELDRQIEKLIAEEVARQERRAREKGEISSAKTENKATTTTSSSSTRRITQPNVALSNSFAANRGRLPYPITGDHTITTRFGTHKHEKWEVSTSSSGIDIRSQSDAEAKAVFKGEVSYVAAIPGYNTCIIVRHGNYYTFYGNIKDIYVKQGETVETGQTLGKVYTDPDTGYSQIHFQLWRETNKLNPEPWLR
ncbi:MAG: peptidoglycan DD-metalloendopeptidase family protein [Prevotella sp.]|jgi:septal ring factor EnvC (AmiA/AmiB activator)|nr:peptidoglycan DD-metalloendopeptidase family protein [Prevotella sp.]